MKIFTKNLNYYSFEAMHNVVSFCQNAINIFFAIFSVFFCLIISYFKSINVALTILILSIRCLIEISIYFNKYYKKLRCFTLFNMSS